MTTFDATVSAAQFASIAPAGGIVRFRGEAGRFWRLLARGAVLLMRTLGIYRFERRLGAAIERQVRASLDTHHTGAAFECGNGEKEKPGRAAFDKLMREIETGADLPVSLTARVVRQSQIAPTTHPGPKLLLDHPETSDRVAQIEKMASSAPRLALLDQGEWAALKTICAGT
jgi:hypothetical protein